MSPPRRDRPPRWGEALLRILLPRSPQVDALLGDLEEEFHERVAAGSPAEARRLWLRRAAGVALRLGLHQRLSALRFVHPEPSTGRATMSTALDDLRLALRSLRRAPGFALLAALTLAAGIGLTTTVFSVVDAILVRSLPYPASEALVVPRYQGSGPPIRNHSEPEYFDYRSVASFEAVAAYTQDRPTLGAGTEAERIRTLRSSWELLPLLGVEPLLGRFFSEAEDAPGLQGGPVVLSHALWMSAFGGRADAVGESILLEGEARTVVGVMPEGFGYPDAGVRAWMPLGLDPADPWGRNNHYLYVVARLAEGVGLPAAQAELTALAANDLTLYPEIYGDALAFHLAGLKTEMVGDMRVPLIVVFAAVLGVLGVAVVNAAALFTARGEERRGEIAVRTALGASRGRVARQLMFESLAVAGVAALGGTALATLGVAVVQGIAPPDLLRLDTVGIDLRVLGFGGALALFTGLLFGIAPSAQAARSDVRSVLATGGRGGVGGPGARSRRTLVVVQLALATGLLLGAGLLVRSFDELRRVDLGFDSEGLLAVGLEPSESVVGEGEEAVAYFAEVERQVAAIPGVTAAGSALRLALADGEDNYSIQVEGREVESSGNAPAAGMQYATVGYREAMGIPLVQGRWFEAQDRPDGALVAVINESLAAELWPGQNPIGRRLRMFPEGQPWIEVVGVVGDVSYLGVRTPPPTKLYIPHHQARRSAYYAPNAMTLLVRSTSDAPAIAERVREVVTTVRPGVPLGPVRSMNTVVGNALQADRFVLLLLGTFAAIALLMAAVSVYGVVARSVAARTREIGLRMALGADRTLVARQVVTEGLAMAAAGCGVGLLAGWWASRAAASLLFNTSTVDPVAWLSVVPILGTTAVAACLLPAWRASVLDPVEALRSD